MAKKEQRELDREAELERQQAVIDAVAARNAELAAGADPDRSAEVVVETPNRQKDKAR